MNDQQIRLKSAADRIAATARRTRSWVSEARGASVSVANEADSLVTEARRVESVARKLSRAAERRMCVGVYGASQQGKSYLVSVLARPPGKAGLLARLGADRLDFITEINPSGGKESTGLVTRFTVHPPEGPADPDFPVDVRLLTETDAPYLTPMPLRGRPNASYLMPYTVRFLAELRGEDLTELCHRLTQNTFAAFGGPW